MANYIHVPDEAPAVPKIDVTVDESDYRSGALKLIRELRPTWKPSEVKIKVLVFEIRHLVVIVIDGPFLVSLSHQALRRR